LLEQAAQLRTIWRIDGGINLALRVPYALRKHAAIGAQFVQQVRSLGEIAPSGCSVVSSSV
jgi:hypothetical protein